MNYLKIYKRKGQNARLSLANEVNIKDLKDKINNLELREKIGKYEEHGQVNLWDLGIEASKVIKNGNWISIVCADELYYALIVAIIKDDSGEIGDAIGWKRLYYNTPWKNIILLDNLTKEKVSEEFLKKVEEEYEHLGNNFYRLPDVESFIPEEVYEADKLPEGARRQITINAYERNPKARKRCINYYGTKCLICGFDFNEFYGPIGKDYILVHHLIPLSEINEKYDVDPIKDLRPVCANCHAIIHRKNPPYLIQEIKQIIASAKK